MTTSSAASQTPVRRSRLLHRNLREDPPVAVGGHGVWLVDAQGREVLDGSGGAAVSEMIVERLGAAVDAAVAA